MLLLDEVCVRTRNISLQTFSAQGINIILCPRWTQLLILVRIFLCMKASILHLFNFTDFLIAPAKPLFPYIIRLGSNNLLGCFSNVKHSFHYVWFLGLTSLPSTCKLVSKALKSDNENRWMEEIVMENELQFVVIDINKRRLKSIYIKRELGSWKFVFHVAFISKSRLTVNFIVANCALRG